MTENSSQRVHRKDYQPPHFLVEKLDLAFVILDDKTHVTSTARYKRNPAAQAGAPLVLNGADLKLISLTLNGTALAPDAYQIDGEELTLPQVSDAFTLVVETEIFPKSNTALEGLYASGPMLCTQCEAEGFRRITYYPDRPDVMTIFTTSIEADKATYPTLLSNGNLIKKEDLGARRRVTWHDPHKKPCYLFALVAGKLEKITDRFTTASKRDVLLEIYSYKGNETRLQQAMVSLKKSMAWDEQRFGREYDLDQFMIVAAHYFNSGAMENKGLNIFNAAYILGDPLTATDRDLLAIESVVAHEYFHNWSGNRVTCRDWFQLSLKEGFTVFRDQEFSCDMHSPATERIDHVRMLRSHQFTEDAGPMAHPVRPDSYLTIDNFYTTTVYEKGAEVVRMLQTLFGQDGFRKGSDLYFNRHDGQAVTCDDFAQSIFDANPERSNDIDLTQFKLWYAQAGTPRVKGTAHYDSKLKTYTLSLQQQIPDTAGQTDKKPMVIPVATALFGKDGSVLAEKLLVLDKAKQDFVFDNLSEPPLPSLLRHFSAPVVLDYAYTESELAFLAQFDTDLFNRWDALQKFGEIELLRLIKASQNNAKLDARAGLRTAFQKALATAKDDPHFAALALALPSEAELAQSMRRAGMLIDMDAIHAAREFLRRDLANTLKDELLACYQALTHIDQMATDGANIGKRALRNTCLTYLGLDANSAGDALAYTQFQNSINMTDQVAALAVLTHGKSDMREKAFSAFYDKWKDNDLVLDKWFSLQAMADRDGVIDDVKKLMQHPAFTFTNPNKIYALVGSFCANLAHFHAKDGRGYQFLADVILKLDGLNPQVAGRRVAPLSRWKDYDSGRAALMKGELERMAAQPNLSKNTREVVEAGLSH